MRRILWAAEGVITLTGYLASALIFLIALFVFSNSASRLAGHSLPWLFDVTTFGMVIMAFVGAGYALREKAHVRVDLMRSRLSNEMGMLFDLFVYIVLVIFCLLLIKLGLTCALNNLRYGTVSVTSTLKVPMWIMTSTIPIGALLLLIQALIEFAGLFRRIASSPEALSAKVLSRFFLVVLVLLLVSVAAFFYLHPVAAMFIFVLFALLAGLPVAFSLGLAGILGLYFSLGGMQLVQVPIFMFQEVNSWSLTAAPLFILGGMLMSEAKVAEKVFSFIETLFVRIPSPLLMATIVSGGIFCAITGSSVAAHAAIATICLPLLFARGYNKLLSVGVVAGCTVGTLIPPSNGFILYGVLTDESIGKLFMAGIGPSIVLFSFYIIYVVVRALIMKEKEKEPALSFTPRERVARLKSGVWGFLAPLIVLGGIYFGFFTPTEGGGILVVYALIVGLFINRTLKWEEIKRATLESVKLSLMILFIVAGAAVYGKVLTQSQLIPRLLDYVNSIGLTPPLYLLAVFVVITILGMFVEAVSIMVITVPITYPIAVALGIDPLWFAVFYIINTEIGLLTPPVGLNLFVLKRVTGMPEDIVFKSTFPFILMMLLTIIVIYFFPGVVTWLPSKMFQ